MKSQLSRRTMLRSVAIGAASAMLAACGATPTPTPPPAATKAPAAAPTAVPAAPKAAIELRIGWWGNITRNKLYDSICDLWTKRNPNVTLVRENAGWADYWTKVATQAAGKNLPDVTASVIDTLAEYGQRGAYLAMEPFIEKGTINTTDWPKSVMDAFKVDNKVYMMPTGITVNIWMINEDMIKRGGLEPPKFETSYDEFAALCKALQAKLPKGVYATHDGGPGAQQFTSWVNQKGYQLAKDAKATELGFPKEVVIDWHKYWMDLYKQGAVLPIEIQSQPVADMWADDFITKGTVASRPTNSNQLKGYQQYQKDNYYIIRHPSMPNGKQKWGDYMRPSALSIAANTKYPEEVAKFINFFVNDIEAIKIFNLELGALGPSKAAQEMMKTVDPKDVLVLKHFEEYAKSAPYHMIDPKGTAAVLTAQTRCSDAIRYGTAIETAVDTFMKEAAEVYKQNA